MKARKDLVRLLQLACAGERGAALAYTGHAAALHHPAERAHVLHIRAEELDHRQRVARLLTELHASPDPLLELRTACVGAAIAAFCQVGGWYLPMYGAGWLERRNIAEYERATWLALACGLPRHASDLLDMAEAEWEHERYFREKAAAHWLARLLPVWRAPGPKAAIRSRVYAHAAPPAVLSTKPLTANSSLARGRAQQLLDDHAVAPLAIEFAVPTIDAHLLKAHLAVQCQAGFVLGKNSTDQLQEAAPLGLVTQRL